jgi:hypothetical protein
MALELTVVVAAAPVTSKVWVPVPARLRTRGVPDPRFDCRVWFSFAQFLIVPSFQLKVCEAPAWERRMS